MLLGFKTEIKVNKKLRNLLAKHAGVAGHAWNQGLALIEKYTREVLSCLLVDGVLPTVPDETRSFC